MSQNNPHIHSGPFKIYSQILTANSSFLHQCHRVFAGTARKHCAAIRSDAPKAIISHLICSPHIQKAPRAILFLLLLLLGACDFLDNDQERKWSYVHVTKDQMTDRVLSAYTESQNGENVTEMLGYQSPKYPSVTLRYRCTPDSEQLFFSILSDFVDLPPLGTARYSTRVRWDNRLSQYTSNLDREQPLFLISYLDFPNTQHALNELFSSTVVLIEFKKGFIPIYVEIRLDQAHQRIREARDICGVS